MISGPVLYAEDEEDDVFLLRHAFKEAGISNALTSVPDGEAALQYLSGSGDYSDRSRYPLPILLLLDVNMPMVSGLEVLQWVRAQPSLRLLPVLILSSSSRDSDVRRAYELGANGYLVKPSALEALLNTSRAIRDFWLIQNFPPPAGDPQPRRAGATLSVLPDA